MRTCSTPGERIASLGTAPAFPDQRFPHINGIFIAIASQERVVTCAQPCISGGAGVAGLGAKQVNDLFVTMQTSGEQVHTGDWCAEMGRGPRRLRGLRAVLPTAGLAWVIVLHAWVIVLQLQLDVLAHAAVPQRSQAHPATSQTSAISSINYPAEQQLSRDIRRWASPAHPLALLLHCSVGWRHRDRGTTTPSPGTGNLYLRCRCAPTRAPCKCASSTLHSAFGCTHGTLSTRAAQARRAIARVVYANGKVAWPLNTRQLDVACNARFSSQCAHFLSLIHISEPTRPY